MTPLDAALQAIPDTLDPFARARVEAMLFGYERVWGGEDVTVLGVEQEFQFPLPRLDGTNDPDWLVGGSIDLVARWRGKLKFFDHKSSSEDTGAGSAYRQRLVMNGQITHYLLAAESLGLEPDGFVFDVLTKPQQKPQRATPVENRKYYVKGPQKGQLWKDQRAIDETPVEYRDRCVDAMREKLSDFFARIDVPRFDEDRDAYLADLNAVTTLIDTVAHHGLRAHSVDNCVTHGRECQFFALCSRTSNLSDRAAFRKKPTIHGELRRPVPPGKRLITTSRRSAFQRCMEYERLAYREGYERTHQDEALSFGTAMHRALNAFWLAWPRQDRSWIERAA